MILLAQIDGQTEEVEVLSFTNDIIKVRGIGFQRTINYKQIVGLVLTDEKRRLEFNFGITAIRYTKEYSQIVKKVTSGAWVQKFKIVDSETELLEEGFEADDIVEYEDENGNPIDPPEDV